MLFYKLLFDIFCYFYLLELKIKELLFLCLIIYINLLFKILHIDKENGEVKKMTSAEE